MGKNKDRLLERQVEKVKELLETRPFDLIPYDQLILPDVGIDSDSDIDEIKQDILENGLLSPISVCGPYMMRSASGKTSSCYKVIEGARRIKALRGMLGSEKVPCYIVDGAVSDRRITLLALSANRVHRSSDNSLNVRFAQLVYDEYLAGEIDRWRMSSLLETVSGLGQRQAKNYLNIIENGYDSVIEDVAKNDLSIQDALTVVKVAPDDEKAQVALAETMKEVPSRTRKPLRKAIRENPDLFAGPNKAEAQEVVEKISDVTRRQSKVRAAKSALVAILAEDTFEPESLSELQELWQKITEKFV